MRSYPQNPLVYSARVISPRERTLRLLIWSALHIGTHFTLYLAIRRRLAFLSSERGILVYHALSSAILLGGGLAVVVMDPSTEFVAGLIGATALHGIYSLSFLELWSLTEGSYSLSILEFVEQTTGQGPAVDMSRLEGLGGAKTEQRLDSLRRLGLARLMGDQVTLTRRGRWIADTLAGLAGSAGAGRTD